MSLPVDYDAELARFVPVFRRAWRVGSADRILDVGCGAGRTTREAAELAPAGGALGVDVSEPAVARARAHQPSPPNAGFRCADAQTHDFPPASFDLAVSRFGTMFFTDPVAAFTNIGRALRPGGRLVMLVWQARDRNEWDVVIRAALGEPSDPSPFSLGDPATVERVLSAAGFTGTTLTDVAEPVYYGPDVATALDWVQRFTCTKEALSRLGPAAAAQTLDRLRAAFAARQTGDGVWFGARAWLVTARRP